MADFAALQNVVSVIKFVSIPIRPANRNCRTISAIQRQLFDMGHCIRRKRRFHHQILYLITSNEHFRQRHQIGIRRAALLPRVARFGRIFGQGPDSWVQLCQC